MTYLAAIIAAVWLGGTEGPSAVVDSPNVVGRVVASRFDGTNDYTTVYFTHELDRAPSAAVCYCAKGATNAVYGTWQGGWTNKVAVGGVQGDTYSAVEYLQSDGASWVDIGVGFTSNVGGIKSRYMYLKNAQNQAIWGSQTSGDNRWSFNQYFMTGQKWWIGSTGSLFSKDRSLNTIYDTEIWANNGVANAIFDGVQQTQVNYSGSIADPNNNIALFAVCNGAGSYIRKSQVIIYYWAMHQDGLAVRHFLPVLHNGEGKMLDIVHNVLYANAGTGSFTVGPSKGTITVPTGGWGQDIPEDPYQSPKWSNCRVLVTRRPASLRNAEARPDLRFAWGNAETATPFAVKGIELTINSNAVEIVDGVLTKKGL